MPQRIQNYNVPHYCCNEKTCDNHSTYYEEIEYKGLKLIVTLCEEHAEAIVQHSLRRK